MADDEKKAIIVGISGASSSGKTTLARLLRDIFPNSFILHQDDFYRPESELPLKDGLLDWDCAAALDIPKMTDSLRQISQHGVFPPDHDSKEDRNSISSCPVSQEAIDSLSSQVQTWLQNTPSARPHLSSHRLSILDGFLLYSPEMKSFQDYLDLKLFMRVDYATCKKRRKNRDGYATIEGWWVDPPGYVDKVVWPNYVRDNAWLYEDGDVEGKYREEVLEKAGIEVAPEEKDGDMAEVLRWAVVNIMKTVEESAKKD